MFLVGIPQMRAIMIFIWLSLLIFVSSVYSVMTFTIMTVLGLDFRGANSWMEILLGSTIMIHTYEEMESQHRTERMVHCDCVITSILTY